MTDRAVLGGAHFDTGFASKCQLGFRHQQTCCQQIPGENGVTCCSSSVNLEQHTDREIENQQQSTRKQERE